MRRWLVIAVPYLWLFLFFLVPFFIVFRLSLSDIATAIPPYTPLIDFSKGLSGLWETISKWDFENYAFIFSDNLYINAYMSSIQIAALSTFLTLLIAYPMAYGMAKAPREWQATLVMLIILPFWTSFLIRVYAWIGILKPEGLLNLLLMNLGLISEPLQIMNTPTAVYIGIVYSYLPFMVLPLYANLVKHDQSLLEAAADLGSRNFNSFWRITVPLSKNGIIAGCMLVFIPVVGEFVIPELLGGPETLMIGKVLWQEFFNNRDWPVASALAVVMLAILLVPIILFNRNQAKEMEGRA